MWFYRNCSIYDKITSNWLPPHWLWRGVWEQHQNVLSTSPGSSLCQWWDAHLLYSSEEQSLLKTVALTDHWSKTNIICFYHQIPWLSADAWARPPCWHHDDTLAQIPLRASTDILWMTPKSFKECEFLGEKKCHIFCPKIFTLSKFHSPMCWNGWDFREKKHENPTFLTLDHMGGTPLPLKNQNFENRASPCFKLALIRPRAKISWHWDFWCLRKTRTKFIPDF